MAARFIDLWINVRVLTRKSLSYNTIQNYIFKTAKDIRNCSVDTLKSKLKLHYDTLQHLIPIAISDFTLNKSNKKHIKNILARIIDFIEEQNGQPHKYVEYMNSTTTDPCEIEHIICNDFERFKDAFYNKDEFVRFRNNIGALLLLRESINRSLRDKDYSKKLAAYCSTQGNIYSASLGKQTYLNNPRFIRFISENNLPFEPYEDFGRTEIEKRRLELVVKLMNLIWNADEFQ